MGSTVPVRPGTKPRWARQLRYLDVDYVLLDLGSGTQPATLDLFLMADMGLCVSTPEPPSVEATYRFTRALFMRVLRRMFIADRFKMRLVERAHAEVGPLPSPQTLVRALARYDTNMGSMAAQALAGLHPRLVVNGVRLRTDLELGPAMCDMARRYLAVEFDYVGHIEQDDAVWLSVVKRRPLLIDSPTSKSARNTERIARRVLALFATREKAPEEKPISLVPSEPDLYDLLWTHRGATDEEVRRAYKRQREIYQSGSLPLTSLLSEGELKSEQARIEEAHDTLLDPIRRKAYDASTFPEEADERPRQPSVPDLALEAEREMLRRELSREINAETEFTGALLRKVRESQGVDLEDIAKHTKNRALSPQGDRGRGLRRVARARLHARLRAGDREVLEARRGAGHPHVPPALPTRARRSRRRRHVLIEAAYGPQSAEPRARLDRDLAFTAALFVLALGVRLFVAIAWSKEPVWDGHYYHFGAERIAAGLGYSEDVLVRGAPVWKAWTHYPVGYSALLGLVYALFGSGPLVGPIFNAFVGAIVVALVHRVARTCLRDTRARVAGAIAALHPGLIVYAALIMTELTAAAFLLGAVLVAVRYRDHFKERCSPARCSASARSCARSRCSRCRSSSSSRRAASRSRSVAPRSPRSPRCSSSGRGPSATVTAWTAAR